MDLNEAHQEFDEMFSSFGGGTHMDNILQMTVVLHMWQ